jgi:SAM-dependent methyltransferase
MLSRPPQTWVSIHSGFDETTSGLIQCFPGSKWAVLDVFDASRMDEPSIARARRMGMGRRDRLPRGYPPTPLRAGFGCARVDRLPLDDASQDAVFLVLAAHEIRRRADREAFFGELFRVLRGGGRIVLVEPARDAANFIAYGPGFMHFLPAREWRGLARTTGFAAVESRRTPFVRVFMLEKRP